MSRSEVGYINHTPKSTANSGVKTESRPRLANHDHVATAARNPSAAITPYARTGKPNNVNRIGCMFPILLLPRAISQPITRESGIAGKAPTR